MKIQITVPEITLSTVIADTLAVDEDGELTGAETTLRELIMEQVQKMWAPSSSRHRDLDRQQTVQDMVAAEVRKQIGSAISTAVKEAHKAALDAIGKVAAQPVVDAVAKALKG